MNVRRAAWPLSALALWTALGVLPAAVAAEPQPAIAGAAVDEDLRAKQLFEAHQFPEAVAIYSRLYQETHHPTYLRNLGRCYQMMRQADEAIRWFEAYLREATALVPAERQEIEGYIAEMRVLKKAVAPPGAGPSVPTPAGPAAAEMSVASPGRRDASPSPTGGAHWWLLGSIGAVVVGVVAIALMTSGTSDKRLPCPGKTTCGP